MLFVVIVRRISKILLGSVSKMEGRKRDEGATTRDVARILAAHVAAVEFRVVAA